MKFLRFITFIAFVLTSISVFASDGDGGVSDGGGSIDNRTGQMVDSYLAKNKINQREESVMLGIGWDKTGWANKGGIIQIYANITLNLLPELGQEMQRVFYEKPWYVVEFDKRLLRRVNKRTRKKLIDAGFLRNTTQVALQTPEFVLIDKKFYDQKMQVVKSAKTDQEKIESLNELKVLWMHEFVRNMEICSRQSPGGCSYRRYDMPGMTEAEVIVVTQMLLDVPGVYDNKKGITGLELEEKLANYHFGYYLTHGEQWADFNKQAVDFKSKLKAACQNSDFELVIDILADIQAIARSDLFEVNSPSHYPSVKMAMRVEYFNFLNSYLSVTKGGKLKLFSDEFEATPSTGKQVCRAIKAAEVVKPDGHNSIN